MGGNGSSAPGSSHPQTAIQAALERARGPEGPDPDTTEFLESVLAAIWQKLRAGPNTYLLTLDEFAVFNFYRERYATDEIAIAAISRFNQVSFNFTVTSRGRQFDRLGLMYLGDTEVFRTSTAEPTNNGIEWTYIKDVSSYLALLKAPQKIIFDLGNLVNDIYTAPFNATLTATFFTSENVVTPADTILPISARLSSSGRPSAFSIPSQNASTTYQFPRNVRRAVATISSCGQADEEFWFGNVLSSDVDAFPPSGAPLFGYSPFREVQLYIDGNLAGVEWPFPIIFTGGVVPGLWRPVVGVDAFDLREHEIDITPWLPLLCDGAVGGHTFEIRVAGIDDDGQGHGTLSKTVANYWVVTGKIFLWLDDPGWITRGSVPMAVTPSPLLELSSSIEPNPTNTNETLNYGVNATRELSVSSIVITSEGLFAASWIQSLAYSNAGRFTAQGNIQRTIQNIEGLDASANGYSKAYNYPVWVNTSYTFDKKSGNFTIDANISRGLNLETWGKLVFPTGLQDFASLPSTKSALPSLAGSALRTIQNGSAHYEAAPALRLALGHGTTEQKFTFIGLQASTPLTGGQGSPIQPGVHDTPSLGYELYRRHVLATNGTVVKDNETLSGHTITDYSLPASRVGGGWKDQEFVGDSVRSILGRGPKENMT
ncbi:hypothetical protein FGG08_001219 [Glutinoglossum americanum]|uniref:Peptide N-acetyl-beta-D-glucosaminyl asparaginase amidase A N-terminal domain-containing protein n=1 Tax=Glutinoglossum americanum TaxID=1670608 RepID=A0A9P8I7F3_9PEZI|nr:hypothetical protein FGG08_001219 [Glutinoglossum americanum]